MLAELALEALEPLLLEQPRRRDIDPRCPRLGDLPGDAGEFLANLLERAAVGVLQVSE